jgi:DNA-binding MarR family transcriptional regulator
MERSAHGERHPAPHRNGGRAARERREPIKLGVLNDHLGYFVRRLQIWVFQDFMRALARVDIRPAQYSVLVVVEANPGLSQSDIAEFLGIERARLVHLLDRLEKRGLTERRASPRDRRSHALYLTREGQRALKNQVRELLPTMPSDEAHRLMTGR